jgi:hypothetical protein
MDRPMGLGIDFADPNSPLAPFYLRATDVLAVFALGLIALFYGLLSPLPHTDVWAHLKLGRWIVEHRQLPVPEPFSPYTDKAAGPRYQPWLTQVGYDRLFAAGQRLAGDDPVRRFVGGAELVREAHALAMVAFSGLMWLAFRRVTGSAALALLGLAALSVAAIFTLGPHRPQVFGLVLFAALLAVLSRPVLTRRAVALVPLAMLVWVNAHGSFVVGFVLVGVAWLGRAVEVGRTDGWRAVARDSQVRRLALALALGAAAAAVNPIGPRAFPEAVGFGGNANLKLLLEWHPLNFAAGGPLPFWYLVSMAGLVAAQAVSPRPFTPTQLLLALTFGVAPLIQQRMLTWWLPVALWVALPHLAATADRHGLHLPRGVPSFRKTLLAAFVGVICLLPFPSVRWLASGEPPPPQQVFFAATPLDLVGAVADPAGPVSERMKPLARALKERYSGRPVGPVFTSIEIGELFYWRDIPGCPPLTFTHAHLFREDHWGACLSAQFGGPEWWELLDRHRVNLIAVEADFCPKLVDQVRARADEWEVVVDQQGADGRQDRARLFVAIRKVPK